MTHPKETPSGFVEKMQEMAHDKAEKDYTGKMRVFHEDDLDTLTETIITATLANEDLLKGERRRIVEQIREEERAKLLAVVDGEMEPLPTTTMTAREAMAHNKALATISAKIKEIM